MEFSIEKLARQNILKMTPYSSARHEYDGDAMIFLDANENSFGSPLPENYNRYPDPLQVKLKEKISLIKGVPAENIFLGNGSDEAIDLLFRIFCEPGKDNALVFPPTYGMYEVCASVNDVEIRNIPLTSSFQLNLEAIENSIDNNTKLIFICSPNNPTGNSMNRYDIEIILNNFNGVVIIDEAYINYSKQRSFIAELTEYPNLVIMQTLSKAWGLAGLRLGMAFAGKPVINLMNKVKYPYNINTATQMLVLSALENIDTPNEWTRITVTEKEQLAKELASLTITQKVYPSDANFLLVKITGARKVYEYLVKNSIIVRDRSTIILCDDSLRITIGTPNENKQLIEALKRYS
ncbi:MAG: histidinol-phosphate transaminase [Chitinophagaceae bacterium]|nr:histidinol-phosphate transaminase [Chitinophagaceae bacterium]MCB9055894.1 histidinol-phosphate transaminase [Chitinophagales bacterium]